MQNTKIYNKDETYECWRHFQAIFCVWFLAISVVINKQNDVCRSRCCCDCYCNRHCYVHRVGQKAVQQIFWTICCLAWNSMRTTSKHLSKNALPTISNRNDELKNFSIPCFQGRYPTGYLPSYTVRLYTWLVKCSENRVRIPGYIPKKPGGFSGTPA